jgi:hypothetical protein
MLMIKLLLLFFVFAQVELFPQMTERVGQRQDELLVEGPKEKCPKIPTELKGRQKLPRESWWTSLDACLTRLNEKHWNVQMGGAWKPSECVAQQRVAILTPHRLHRQGTLNIGIKKWQTNIFFWQRHNVILCTEHFTSEL